MQTLPSIKVREERNEEQTGRSTHPTHLFLKKKNIFIISTIFQKKEKSQSSR